MKRVQCWSACGLLLWLAGFSFSAHAQAIPNAPTNLLANAVFVGQINLTWSDTSTNEDGFKIERTLDNGGSPSTWTQIATVGVNVTNYSDAGLPANTRYWYRVRAYNAGGNSDYSNQVSATTPPCELLTAQVSGSTNLCLGGAGIIQAALTGTGPWNLVWSDGFTQTGIVTSPAVRVVSPSVTTSYSVLSVSETGCATGLSSGVVIVRVSQSPVIASQPASATVCAGNTVTFSVAASGVSSGTNGSSMTVTTASDSNRFPVNRIAGLLGRGSNRIPPDIGGIAEAVAKAANARTSYVYSVAVPMGQRPDRILVKPKKQALLANQQAVLANLAAHHRQLGTTVKRTFSRIGDLQILKLPPGLTVEQAVKHYQDSGLVEYAEPDYQVHAILTPNDPRYLDGSLWNLNNTGQNGGTPHADIAAPAGWDTRTSADPIIVADIDTGAWYTHEDLASNMWVNPCVSCPVDGVVYSNDVHGINAITGTGDPLDDHFHGTHTAGIIGAVGNNSIGVVGVAWNIRIMVCKFLDANGSGYTSDAIECVDYAVSKGAKVLSNSWGGGPYDEALHDAIAAARAAGVIFVAAAGNNGANNDASPFYPANYDFDLDNVVAVAATDYNDQLAWFSNYGAALVGLGAPGVNILSTLPGIETAAMQSYGLSPNYGVLSGTSMACPHVAGAIALVRAQYPAESYSQIIQRVLNGTDPVSNLNGRILTGGRLNLFNALTQAPQPPFWLYYQWRRNGVNIPGQTASSCSFGPVTTSDDGAYFDVIISNSCGSVISTAAVLTVDTACQIVTQPVNVTQCVSDTATLSVSVTGSMPISYRWRKIGGGWGSPWVLTESGPGSGSLFIGSSTNNGDRTYDPSSPTDIDTSGKAFGINASGGHTMQVTRSLIEPLPPGGVFTISMDNGYVGANGSAGIAMYSVSNKLWFEFYCTNNTYYYYWATGVTPQPAGWITFSSHPISIFFDMFPDGLLFIVVNAPSGSTLFVDYMPSMANDPPDHFVLYNNNAGSGPANDIYFNNFAGYEDYSLSDLVRYDDATQAAYTNGWQNGDDGGTGPIAGATNSAYVIPSCALTDSGTYNVIVKNQCGFVTSSDIVLTVLPAPCSPATSPAAPSSLTATLVSANQIALSWTDNSNTEDGFKIERSTDGTNFSQIAQVLPDTTTYRNSGLWPGTTYYYRVRAYNWVGPSDFSNVASANTPVMCLTAVVGWGDNSYGQRNPPAGLSNVVAIAAGCYHSLTLKSDGTVLGWGDNSYGQRNPPAGLGNVVAIAAAFYRNLALKSDGTVVGWGYNCCGEATPPAGLSGVVAIAAGALHSLALKSDGTVVGWGYNWYGQATPPAGLSGAVAIAAGDYHSLALKSDGTVVGWGDNQFGQATPPAGLTGVVAIAAGGRHSLALKSDGTVVGWGDNSGGQAMPPAGLSGVAAVAAGIYHSLALKSDSTVVGWGYDGDGGATPPAGLSNVVALAAGGYFSLGLTWVCSPNAPSALTATAVSTNQIDLIWTDNASNEAGFKVERAPDSGGAPGTWTQIAAVDANVTSHTDSGLAPSTKYWYRVRAYNAIGNSPYSNQASATTLQAPLGAPSGLTAAAVSAARVDLSWTDNAASEDGFRIERAISSGGPWSEISSVSSNVTAYPDTGVICGQTYFYRVRAYNAAGGSPYSDTASANTSTVDTDSDGIPDCWMLQYFGHPMGQASDNSRATDDSDGDGQSNLAEFLAGTDPTNNTSAFRIIHIAQEGDDVRVTWATAGGRTNVLQATSNLLGVYFSISPNIMLPGEGDVVTNYLDKGAATNATCRFYRVALRAVSIQETNAPSLAITSPSDNFLITNSTVTVTGTSADLSGVAGVEVHGIAASSADGYSNWVAVVTGLSDGTNTLTVLAGDNAAPANIATSTVHVICATGSYDGNGDGLPDGWQIKYFGSVDAPNAAPTADPDGDGLTNLQEYLMGTDPTLPSPAAPSNLMATAVLTNQIDLSWTDNSSNEDGFKIERAPDTGGSPGTWEEIATVDTNVTTYSDTGLSATTRYWYRVRAYNTGGDSGYSNPVSAITLLAPSGLTATAVSTNQVNLSWTDNSSNEDGFKIERAPDSGGSPGTWAPIATVGANVTSYNDTGLPLNTKYWYRVRAYNAEGDSDYSNPASDTTLPLPPQAPSNLTATTVSSSQINLSWADNSGNEDGFKIERSTDGTNFTQIAQVLPNTTTYRNTGLMSGVTYYYRVRAYNRGGDSDASNVANATTLTQCSFSAVVAWGQSYYGQTNVPPGLTNVVAIAAGDSHSLALRSNGTVVGWGSNGHGQTNVPASVTNAVAIAAGRHHSLALKSDGTVVGWGYNSDGQTNVPASVTNAVAIAAGYYHSLALKSDGTVVGWGHNYAGQTNSPAGLRGVVAVAAGGNHNLALKSDGTVVGWGYNGSGRTNVPASVTNAVAIAAGGYHSLALKSDGTVVGWGWNNSGQTNAPAGLSNVVAIAAGCEHSLALKSDGTVVGWGRNDFGETNVPPGVVGVAAISAGDSFSLALMCVPGTPSGLTASAVSASRIDLSWVGNSFGDGFKIERSTDGTNFVQIAQVLASTTTYRNTGLAPGNTYYYRVRAYNAGGNSDFSNVASATTPALCVTSVAGWGDNRFGQAAPPAGLTGVVAVAAGAGSFYSLALKSDGTVVKWGSGGGTAHSPVPPAWLSNVVAIAAGGYHSLALKSDGTVVGWGLNDYGQTNVPPGLTNAVAIAAGNYHSLALRSDGTVVGWGDNGFGQTNVPSGLRGVVAIAAGNYHSLALRSDGTVVGWGYNASGQTNVPASVTNAVAIAAGYSFSLALTSDGTVVGWGSNSYGQKTPPPGLTNAVAIAAGRQHSLALRSDGTVVGWGDNAFGQTNSPAGLTNVLGIAAGYYHSLAITCGPSAPSLLVATAVSTNQINLSWTDNSINENRFGIERAASSTGPWTEIGSVDFDVATYSDTGLSCGQTYYYRVRAYDADGGSPYSNIASANTSPDDLDCDGIADAWTQQYFGHPTGQTNDNSLATDDADGDGQNNLAEFRGGTDPTNSASAFRIIEVWPEDEDMFITWSAVGGKWYVVQTATNFIGGLSNSFYDLNPVIIAPGTDEFPLTVLHLGAATNAPTRLYRIRLAP